LLLLLLLLLLLIMLVITTTTTTPSSNSSAGKRGNKLSVFQQTLRSGRESHSADIQGILPRAAATITAAMILGTIRRRGTRA